MHNLTNIIRMLEQYILKQIKTNTTRKQIICKTNKMKTNNKTNNPYEKQTILETNQPYEKKNTI